MVTKFIQALTSQVPKIIGAGQDLIVKFIGAIAAFVPKLVSKGVDIILSFIKGIADNVNKVVSQGADLIIKFIEGIGKNMNKIANKGADAVITFLHELENTIRTKGPELRDAGWGVADALLDGIWSGIDGLAQKVVDKLGWLVRLLPDKVKKLLGIKSPSTVFMSLGKFTMLGFQKGIEDNQKPVYSAAEGVGTGLIGSFQRVLGIHSPSDVMREIGMQVNRGFADGLRGSADQIRDAFQSLNDKLRDAIRDEKTTISEGHKKVEDLQQQHADKLAEIARLKAAKKPDQQAIADAVKEAQDLQKQIQAESKAITQNEAVLKTNRSARNELVNGMKAERAQLIGLKKNYEDISKQLEEAQHVLDDATRARDDAQKSFTEKYSATPTIDTDEKVSGTAALVKYKQQLAERIKATQQYAATLQQLRALGLDDTTYKKLIEQGVEGQEFAKALLAGGKGGIAAMNALDQQLLVAAGTLATDAAKNLYQAGVDAAQGLVNGLTSKKATLEKMMEDLASAMVRAIKRKLKIKSPSQIFGEIGKLSIAGLAQGLKANTKTVEDASASVGESALSAMQGSLSGISEHIDIDPVITPVLDLSEVQKGAKQLGALTNVTPITAAASYRQASAISASQAATSTEVDPAGQTGTNITFNQTNTSPESLSDIEIYRQTNNQLASLKRLTGVITRA
jgi:hypothetical protein